GLGLEKRDNYRNRPVDPGVIAGIVCAVVVGTIISALCKHWMRKRRAAQANTAIAAAAIDQLHNPPLLPPVQYVGGPDAPHSPHPQPYPTSPATSYPPPTSPYYNQPTPHSGPPSPNEHPYYPYSPTYNYPPPTNPPPDGTTPTHPYQYPYPPPQGGWHQQQEQQQYYAPPPGGWHQQQQQQQQQQQHQEEPPPPAYAQPTYPSVPEGAQH
ncbi:hypothetical protein HK104_003639, partial [Borealophlyctis nickersoniae]